ncbi:MAG TPA: NBR1-Ig-like domain-containing protein [Anaerolineales bacterium]|nr:NBR1-Ig-like domain-containing protein [Anaerolineales bacterium]
MSALRIYKIFTILTTMTLLVSACGAPQLDESAMATAVAQTVQAQNTLETAPATSVAPTLTITPPALASLPAAVTETPVTGAAAAGLCSASASLVGETYPDGTIVQPGETFTKVWHVQNSGTCTWDSTWQLIYYSGDLMDGSAVYSFPQPAQPGQTVEVPIILRAPAQNGNYTGEWMLKSPWGQSFGVGQYSVPMSVSIVVGSGTPENRKTETVFGVTAVTYQVHRQCAPANTFYTITAFITTSGPLEITFTWVQSDGNNRRNNVLNFTEATTKSAEREWSQHKDSSPNPRWVQVIVTSPTYQEFDKVVLPDLCPSD